MNLPTISIVTISFNQAKYLEECICSVLDQDYPNIDYIVVDPGSTDGSRNIIERYQDRLGAVVFEPDRGPADGLNNGFRHAKGQIFGYINADDRLAPGALRIVGEYLAAHDKVDVLCGAIRIVDEQGHASNRRRTADLFDPVKYAAGICTVGQQGTFFRENVFHKAGGFNPANRITWDGELLVDMALADARYATINKVLGDFRIYPGSITGSQRFRTQYINEQNRVAQKIEDNHLILMNPWKRRLARLAYRYNPLRHLQYLTVR